MKRFQKVKAYAGKALAVAAGSVGLVTAANAEYMADISAAVTTAKADALTVGGYVLAAVAGLIVISLIMKLIHKV